MEPRFTSSEERVLQAMFRLSRPATTNEIAKWAQMSWNTADSTLKNLSHRRVVILDKFTDAKVWVINN